MGVMSIGTLICDSEANTYLTKDALYNYIDRMHYIIILIICTKIKQNLQEIEGNNLENHLILRRISATKLLTNKIEMKTSLVNKTVYRKSHI